MATQGYVHPTLSSEFSCFARHEQADNKTEQSQDRAENLNDKYFNEPRKQGLPKKSSVWVGNNLAYRLGSAASASAALLPLIPTDTPQIKLHIPTVIPDQNSAYPVYWFAAE